MPKSRQKTEIWRQTRRKVFERDLGLCQRCGKGLQLRACHVDHIVSGKLGSNHIDNLRLLCRYCHTLRVDKRHRGMVSSALRQGLIGPDWRDHLWEG
jgi:5-methylcytosine-specific restriction endonuclease McrA